MTQHHPSPPIFSLDFVQYKINWAFPRERHADLPPPSFLQKVAKLSYWSQKMRNVLKRTQNNFQIFFYIFFFNKMFIRFVRDLFDKKIYEKFSFAPI